MFAQSLWSPRVVLVGSIAALAVWAGCSNDDAAPATGVDAEADAGSAQAEAGSDSVDASATLPEAVANVPVTYGSCPAFTPCGGNLEGKWNVTGGCLSEDTFAVARQECPGIKETDVVIKAGGSVVMDGSKVARKTAISLSAKIAIPQVCTTKAGGSCTLVGTYLQTGGGGLSFDKADCTSDGEGGCNCDVAMTVKEDSLDNYRVSGNTLTTSGGKTFDYCVAGDKNTYEETTEGALPFVLELGK